MTVKIGLYKGQGAGSGRAIYLGNGSHGYRIAGPKCWGFITPVNEFEMSIEDLKDLIKTIEMFIAKEAEEKS